jgi:tRNA pseudouridine13 synthase
LTNSSTELPRICANLPAIGGSLKNDPADFVVDEVPLYPLSGEGQHLFLHIEKIGLNTEDIAVWLRRLGFQEIGIAGKKDRHAVTRQYVSVERRKWKEEFGAEAPPGITILSATPHANKLKTGHLLGNRFAITVRGTSATKENLAAISDRIAQLGIPNYFGEQRFGRLGDNAQQGRKVLRGELRLPKSKAQFLLSALQSELFNDLLARRVRSGTWRTVLPGDVLKKTQTGGLFQSVDPAVDQPRLDSREVSPAGPLFGPDMTAAAGAALALEEQVLADAQMSMNDFAQSRVATSGTRRSLIVYPEDVKAELAGEQAVTVSFFLPKGSYATVVLREFMGDSGP